MAVTNEIEIKDNQGDFSPRSNRTTVSIPKKPTPDIEYNRFNEKGLYRHWTRTTL